MMLSAEQIFYRSSGRISKPRRLGFCLFMWITVCAEDSLDAMAILHLPSGVPVVQSGYGGFHGVQLSYGLRMVKVKINAQRIRKKRCPALLRLCFHPALPSHSGTFMAAGRIAMKYCTVVRLLSAGVNHSPIGMMSVSTLRKGYSPPAPGCATQNVTQVVWRLLTAVCSHQLLPLLHEERCAN